MLLFFLSLSSEYFKINEGKFMIKPYKFKVYIHGITDMFYSMIFLVSDKLQMINSTTLHRSDFKI